MNAHATPTMAPPAGGGETPAPTAPRASSPVRALWLREWRATSRLARTPWLVAMTGVGLAALLLLIGVASSSPSDDVGRTVFQIGLALMVSMVTLFAPAIAANTIVLEREGKTWEALVMAGVSPRAVDRGKFLGAYTHLGMYLLALLPAAGVPHVFGGVTYGETLLSLLMVLTLGAVAIRFGLLMSAAVGSTRTALLVTIGASVVAAGILSTLGTVMTELLRTELDMHGGRSDGPAFWSTALVNEPFGFDWLRYLVVLPVGALAVTWFSLRELTVYALEPASAARPSRLTYVAILTAAAALLGLLPTSSSNILLAEVLFTLCSFVGIVVVASDRPSRSSTTLGRSLLLVGAGTGGLFVILGIARGILPASMGSDWSDRHLRNMLVYAPPFTVFVTGLAALLRTLLKRPALGRAVTVLATLLVSIAPLALAISLKAGGSPGSRPQRSETWALAASPFAALTETWLDPVPLVTMAILWSLLGVVLLALTHRREASALRAARAS